MSCAIQSVLENQTFPCENVGLFMNKFEQLPDEIIRKILYYAYPKVDDTFKKSIKIASSHVKLNIIIDEWIKIKDIPFQDSIHYSTSIKNTKQNIYEIFHNLKNCGCCERHSQGVYYNIDGDTILHFQDKINDDFTIKKKHKKTTYDGKKCTCHCRHHMRQIITCIPII